VDGFSQDVLIRPKRSTLESRAQVSLERTFLMRHAKTADGQRRELTCVPIFVANMDTTGTFAMATALAPFQVLTALHKHYELADWLAFDATASDGVMAHLAISIGSSEAEFEKLKTIVAAVPRIGMIVLDVANGYTEFFVDALKRVRAHCPDKIIIAGNVVTGEMTEELVLSGADIVKVGIGPGSVCLTRVVAGVGYPQLSAAIECADAAHGLGAQIISDGGCTCPGDFAKAFGAGSDFVMAGGMFSGHTESGGDLVERDGKQYKTFYGMSSKTAMEKHHGGVAAHRASEGKTVEVPFRGPVSDTVQQILGGVRSACTYVGAAHLKELSKRTTFVRCTQTVNQVFGTSSGMSGAKN
jgi:GMP reductase